MINKNKSITIKNNLIVPSLKDSPLSGIIEAEGCFISSILSYSFAYSIRYILTQMWDVNKLVLSHILDLFSIERVDYTFHPVTNVWEL